MTDQYARHGLIGDLVDLYEPHTESDPRGIVLATLTTVGALIGPGPHVRVGPHDSHPGRLFAVMVGRSAVARKTGTVAPVRDLMRYWNRSDQWAALTFGGLASGPALIGELAKASDPARGLDRRMSAMIYEPEFSSVLTVAEWPSSTISQTIRAAWVVNGSSTVRRPTRSWWKAAQCRCWRT